MENYKQKYERALKQAKKELEACGSLDCDAARQIFRLFPELKKNENERIREELIHFLETCQDTRFVGNRKRDKCSRYVITVNPAKDWIVPKYAESTKIKQVLPCWSLGALMELIPKIYESEDDGGCYPTLCKRYDTDKWHCLYHRDTLYQTRQYDTAIEAVIEMVIWLLKYELI